MNKIDASISEGRFAPVFNLGPGQGPWGVHTRGLEYSNVNIT